MNNTIQNEKITEISLRIVELLSKTPFKLFTIEKIKENLVKNKFKTNYATVYRNVDRLVRQGILTKKKYGMASQIQINGANEKTVSLLSYIETRKFDLFFSKLKGVLLTVLKELISDIKGINDLKTVLVFGSYAKGIQHKASDLDLFVVYDIPNVIGEWGNEQKENYVNNIKSSIIGIIKSSQLRGGVNINPIIVSSNEHKEMIINNEYNVAKETLLNHVILKGPYQYWLDVFNAK